MLAHGLEGRAVVHPCCNNGRDLLSIKRLGAERCFGFDIADAFIEQGKDLAMIAGVDVELKQADVYDLGNDYDEQFDIAYITAGTVRLLPDIPGLFAVVRRLMKPGGWLFLQEMHPILDMYSMEPSQKPRKMKHSYFLEGAYESTRGLDYHRIRPYRAKPCYRFHHKLSHVLQALIDSGLVLETIDERTEDTSGGTFARLQKRSARLPLSYTLTAVRPSSD